jgi:hypothetical protein
MLCSHFILILIFKRWIAGSVAVENITNLLPVAFFSAGVVHNEIRYYMEENITGTPIVCVSNPYPMDA